MEVLHYMGAGLGLGLAVIGAGLGIGKLANGMADGIARQPSAGHGGGGGIGGRRHYFALPARPRGKSQTMAMTAR